MTEPAMDEDYTDFYDEELLKIRLRINKNQRLYPIHIEYIENILHEMDNNLSGGHYMSFATSCDPKIPDDE